MQPLASGLGRGYNALQMDIDPKYQEILDYLYSYIDFSLEKVTRYSAERFDLDRMREFMAALGNPQNQYKILHIAGTKGKGSVAALCASALQQSGLTVGMYTSPHLQDYAERIQVDGTPIPHDDLIALVEEIKPKITTSPEITTFEITTALAYLYFARRDVNVAVMEVGLGGRLDATNVCVPDVTVITSISYDHTYLLGETLAEIAAEKAGIIKTGIPVIVSSQMAEARETITRIAAERAAPVVEIGEDYLYRLLDKSLSGQSLEVWLASESEQDSAPVRLSIPLLGDHQLQNAATAFAALMVAKEHGIAVSDYGIQHGFRTVQWPGRFEILRQDPALIIDSAHNRDSAQKLYNVLEDYFPGQKVVLVFGASEDKDISGMLTELKPGVDQVVATKSTHPRAADPEELVNLANKLDLPAILTQTVEEAMIEAEQLSGGKTNILVTGSIFVAAAARSVWLLSVGENDFTHIGKKL
ncbi:MAG: folylpolyglutamate synthase/dihydrofolate synthase family protein [Anaerolineales bacterium]